MVKKVISPCRVLEIAKKYWSFLFIGCFCFCMLIFICLHGERIYINANDTLDSNIAYYKVYRDAWLNKELGKDFVPPLLGGDPGVERLFGSRVGLIACVYTIFPPFTAYIIMIFIRMAAGIIGWMILARVLLGKPCFCSTLNYSALLGFIYGILPVWPMSTGISFLPLVLAVCIWAYRNNNIWMGLLLIPYALFGGGGLALYGVFLLGFLSVFVVIDFIKSKRINKGILSCLAILLATYLVCNYEMIFKVASGNTIRSGWSEADCSFSIRELVDTAWSGLRCGIYHCGTNQQFFVFPVCVAWFLGSNIYAVYKRCSIKKIILVPYNLCFLWFVCNGFFYACAENDAVMHKVYATLPFFKGLLLERILFFNPLALYLCLLLIVIQLVSAHYRLVAKAVLLMAFLSVIFGQPSSLLVVMYNDIGMNIRYALEPSKITYPNLTWEETVSEDLFEKIKQDIDYDGEWAVAHGFVPSILNYNGIATLDGYDSGYTAEYKKQFAKLIRPYLDSGGESVEYFENSGIRAYVFHDDLRYMPGQFSGTDNVHMLMDTDVFQEMNGTYIFSLAHIANDKQLGLSLIGDFTDEKSPYRMSVYKINK